MNRESGSDPTPSALDGVQTLDDLARMLRELRRREARRRGDSVLTYRELAAAGGWSHAVVGLYLTGKALPPTDRLDVLVRLLGATPTEQGAFATARDRVDEKRRGANGSSPTAGNGVTGDGADRDGGASHGGASHGEAARGAHGPAVPRQLPAPVRYFAGRAAELDALTALADEATKPGRTVVISAIDGTAGIGKTTLAVHWAHRVADRFPDGQVYLNLRGFDLTAQPVDPAEAARLILNAFEVAPERIPAGLDARAALLRNLLADRRVLVVLDNARDAEQVRALLPTAPGCVALVTSRNDLSGLVIADGARPITLGLLTAAEAWELLADRIGRDRLTAEPGAADELIRLCSRLPLALAVVAARAATRPGFSLAALAREIRPAAVGLDAFALGDPATDVRAVFSWSFDRLSPEAARMFRLLGLHPGPHVGAVAAASLAGGSLLQTRAALAELARAHLVAEPSPGRFTFHDLLRAYAIELGEAHESEDERQAAVHRLLDHYLHTATAADRLLFPGRDPITPEPARPWVTPETLADYDEAVAWFTGEHEALLAVIDLAANAGMDVHIGQLAWSLTTYLELRGHWHDEVFTQGLALAAAQRLGDRTGQAHAHRYLSRMYAHLGRDDDAHTHFQRAVELYAELGDHLGQAHASINVGWVLERQGRIAEALEHSRRALELYRLVGHRTGTPVALNAIGWYLALLGEYEQALVHCKEALVLHQEVGFGEGEANCWDSLGYAHANLRHHAEAVACYERALELWRGFGDRYNEAETLDHIGDAYRTAGDPKAAGERWRAALAIFDELGHSHAEAVRAKLTATR